MLAAALGALAVVNVLLDTDMSIDVDDVGALCVLHALADLGEVNILAVVHNTASPHGVGAISAINRFYGRDRIPVGAYNGRVGAADGNPQSPWGFKRFPPLPPWQIGPYVDDLVNNFPSRIRNASRACFMSPYWPNCISLYCARLSSSQRHRMQLLCCVKFSPPQLITV